MLLTSSSYTIYPLGDVALTIDFGNSIDEHLNNKVLDLFSDLKTEPIDGTTALIPAYSSLTILYDVMSVKEKCRMGITAFKHMAEQVELRMAKPVLQKTTTKRQLKIPVCYDMGYAPDLDFMANELNISPEEIIHTHISATYKVYMLGFLPGFAYMGVVPQKIAIARKQKPITIPAGSVGIAGKQTGIYPLKSPGGWQIIGKTPVTLFNKEEESPTLFQPGDEVQFFAITKEEMEEHLKNKLQV